MVIGVGGGGGQDYGNGNCVDKSNGLDNSQWKDV